MRRPILNRTPRGWPTYNPFLGSGTKLAAAELTVRLCLGIQLDAKYVDVMVQRWQTRNGETAKLSRLTAGPSRAVPKPTCGTGNCAACWPARTGELCQALPDWSNDIQWIGPTPGLKTFTALQPTKWLAVRKIPFSRQFAFM